MGIESCFVNVIGGKKFISYEDAGAVLKSCHVKSFQIFKLKKNVWGFLDL